MGLKITLIFGVVIVTEKGVYIRGGWEGVCVCVCLSEGMWVWGMEKTEREREREGGGYKYKQGTRRH